MIDKHLQKLNLNPFMIGLIYQSFYNGYGKSECPILLHYIVSPLVFFKDSRVLFLSITKNASISKIIDDNTLAFIELQERIWKMKELSNLSLISLHNQDKILLKNIVEIKETIKYESINVDFKDLLRAAHYLGILFSDIDVHDVFKIFKVIP